MGARGCHEKDEKKIETTQIYGVMSTHTTCRGPAWSGGTRSTGHDQSEPYGGLKLGSAVDCGPKTHVEKGSRVETVPQKGWKNGWGGGGATGKKKPR